eukprot:8701569-Pyramimonas_sp.AAC.1
MEESFTTRLTFRQKTSMRSALASGMKCHALRRRADLAFSVGVCWRMGAYSLDCNDLCVITYDVCNE